MGDRLRALIDDVDAEPRVSVSVESGEWSVTVSFILVDGVRLRFVGANGRLVHASLDDGPNVFVSDVNGLRMRDVMNAVRVTPHTTEQTAEL